MVRINGLGTEFSVTLNLKHDWVRTLLFDKLGLDVSSGGGGRGGHLTSREGASRAENCPGTSQSIQGHYHHSLPPGDRPNPGTEPGSPALQADSLSSEPLGKPGEGAAIGNRGIFRAGCSEERAVVVSLNGLRLFLWMAFCPWNITMVSSSQRDILSQRPLSRCWDGLIWGPCGRLAQSTCAGGEEWVRPQRAHAECLLHAGHCQGLGHNRGDAETWSLHWWVSFPKGKQPIWVGPSALTRVNSYCFLHAFLIMLGPLWCYQLFMSGSVLTLEYKKGYHVVLEVRPSFQEDKM